MARHRPSSRRLPIRSWLLLVVVLGSAGLALYAASLDWRRLLENRLTESLGRPVSIGGIEFAPELPPRLSLEDVAIGGAPGAEPVAAASEVTFVLTPWEMLRGGPLGQLSIYGFRLAAGRGETAWISGPARVLRHVQVVLQEGQFGEEALIIDRADLGIARGGLRSFSASVFAFGEALSAEGRIGFSDAAEKASLLQLTVRSDAVEVEFDGTIRSAPFDFSGIAALQVLDADLLAERLGLPFFALDRLRATGMIEKTGQKIEVTRLEGSLGDLRLLGRANYLPSLAGKAGRLLLNIASGPVVLAPAALDEVMAAADFPFEIEAEIAAESLQIGAVVFPRLETKIALGGGDIAVERLVMDGLGGTIEAAGSLRLEGDEPRLDLLFDLRDADAEAVLQALGLNGEAVGGRFGAHLELGLAGRDWETAFGRADGRLALFLDRATLGRPILATLTGTSPDKVPAEAEVACALGDFVVNRGIAQVQLLRLMAPEGDIAGLGWIHPGGDALALVLGNSGFAEPPFLLAGPLALTGQPLMPRAALEHGAAPLPAIQDLIALTSALAPQIRSALGDDSACLTPPSERPPEGGREEAE